MVKKETWDWEIKAKSSWFGTSLKELYLYKDLLFRLVRKEFLLRYQQTILGPVWILIQPVITVITYVVVFNKVIGISTIGVPPVLFYLTGITLWNLFSDIFNGTASTFVSNIAVFSKVYFPRIISPISILFLHCIRFLIQLGLLLIVLAYYSLRNEIDVNIFNFVFFIPAVLVTAATALGARLVYSILTAKYRDLSNLLGLLINFLMFISPIFYALSMVPQKIKWLVTINPLSSQFELFRYAFLGKGEVNFSQMAYSIAFMVILLYGGILLFNRKGDALMDVV